MAVKSWLLLDATSGQVIASRDADARIEPASLTKMLTAYLVFAAIRDKKLELNQLVQVSEHAWKIPQGSSKMFISPDKPVTVNDLLYGLLVQSGNDAAVALAEAVAGTEQAFITQMNQTARQLGMNASHFDSPHGLPSAQTYSTSRDLSLLASRLIADFPGLYGSYDATKSFTYNQITQQNRNRLLWIDPSVDGIKTGHTRSAGFCLVASASRSTSFGARRLISVVVGAASDKDRTQESERLLNWGFANFDTVKMLQKGKEVATHRVWKGEKNTIQVGVFNDVYVTVPKGSGADLAQSIQYDDPIIAPVTPQSRIGTISLVHGDKTMRTVPLHALQPVASSGVLGRGWDPVKLWLN